MAVENARKIPKPSNPAFNEIHQGPCPSIDRLVRHTSCRQNQKTPNTVQEELINTLRGTAFFHGSLSFKNIIQSSNGNAGATQPRRVGSRPVVVFHGRREGWHHGLGEVFRRSATALRRSSRRCNSPSRRASPRTSAIRRSLMESVTAWPARSYQHGLGFQSPRDCFRKGIGSAARACHRGHRRNPEALFQQFTVDLQTLRSATSQQFKAIIRTSSSDACDAR